MEAKPRKVYPMVKMTFPPDKEPTKKEKDLASAIFGCFEDACESIRSKGGAMLPPKMKIKTSYKKQVIELAKKLKAKIIIDRNFETIIEIESPTGMLWKSCDAHCLIFSFFPGDKKWETQLWESVLVDMQEGLEPCQFNDCEYCNP